MKYNVTTFKNLKICIKELEPFIRSGQHIETGRPFKKFGNLLPREVLALWLLCVVLSDDKTFNRWKICTAPLGGDGMIMDSLTNESYLTEHILVSLNNKEKIDIESLIIKHIEKKQKKGGKAYASGKILIVFLHKNGGNWYPNRVARNLPKTLDFEETWVVGFNAIVNEEYQYNVAQLNPRNSPVWKVYINSTFDRWDVQRTQ